MRNIVVLPQPEGPSSATNSPFNDVEFSQIAVPATVVYVAKGPRIQTDMIVPACCETDIRLGYLRTLDGIRLQCSAQRGL
jgi:hypothetical protein